MDSEYYSIIEFYLLVKLLKYCSYYSYCIIYPMISILIYVIVVKVSNCINVTFLTCCWDS